MQEKLQELVAYSILNEIYRVSVPLHIGASMYTRHNANLSILVTVASPLDYARYRHSTILRIRRVRINKILSNGGGGITRILQFLRTRAFRTPNLFYQ